MGGLSSTLYDAGSIALTGDHSASATSGSTAGGRALSDTGHTSSGGFRVAAIDLTAWRSATPNVWAVGVVGNTSNLTTWVGTQSDAGYWWQTTAGQIDEFINGFRSRSVGTSVTVVGLRIWIWVRCDTRRVWLTASNRGGERYGVVAGARPDTNTSPLFTVPGTGPLHIALSPVFGASPDTTTLRLRSRYSDLADTETLGALPWDARSVTLNLVMRESIGGAYIASGTEVSYHVFERSAGGLLTPTTFGTATVGASGALALPASISVDPGATVWVAVSTSNGTPGTQARSHFMPVTAP